jgi:hypothetical protein
VAAAAALRVGTGGIASARTPPTQAGGGAVTPRRFSAGLARAAEGGDAFVTPQAKGGGGGAGGAAAANGDWGALSKDWAHLPFMAIPDGAHELTDDVVFFSLPPDVHCVSCFRQVDAIDAVTHSASRSTREVEINTAARGSVQKSVVLMCRRPLFGFLAARLAPAVRRYFDQADFARTDALAELFHELNMDLAHPRLRLTSTLFHGVSLCDLLLTLGPQALAVVKLVLLEKRVVFYSQPVARASAAVVAVASLLPGALDSVAPAMPPLDVAGEQLDYGLPLALFGARDRVSFQPYAPLPVVSDLLRERGEKGGCLVGTSHNVGVLLASTAANAAKAVAVAVAAAPAPGAAAEAEALTKRRGTPAAGPQTTAGNPSLPSPGSVASAWASEAAGDDGGDGDGDGGTGRSRGPGGGETSVGADARVRNSGASASPPAGTGGDGGAAGSRISARGADGNRGGGRLPVVDALVNLTTGKVSVSSAVEPLCRITRQERWLMKDLMVAASASLAKGAGAAARDEEVASSEEYIRGRFREYLLCFLASVAAVPGVLGGPRGGETWSSEMAAQLDTTALAEYNPQFVQAWLQTRNAAFWARRCPPKVAARRSVPPPELDVSLIDEALLPAERVAAGLTGLRENVVMASSLAAQGLSSLFSHLEVHMVRLAAPALAAAAAATATTPPGHDPAQSPAGTPKARKLRVSQSAPAVPGGGPRPR